MSAKDIKKYQMKKGQTLNPNGRPPKLVSHLNNELLKQGYEPVKNAQITDAFSQMLNLPIEEIKKIAEPSTAYPFFYKLVAKELLGKRGAEMLEKMMDRAYGRAKQTTELTGADGGAIQTVSIDPKKYAAVRKKMLKEDDV